jgi:hypothetical protein
LQRSSDKEQAKRLLQIIVAAARPLSVNEIGVALYIRKEICTYKDLELQEGDQLEITIRHLCGLFINIVEMKVLLIHQTTKEFLVARNDLPSLTLSKGIWKHSLSVQKSNFLLADIYIQFLRLEEFCGKFSSQKREGINALISKYDFLEYSAINWAIHFRAAVNPNNYPMIALGLELCNVQADQHMGWELIICWHVKTRPRTPLLDLLVSSLLPT